MYIKLYTVSWAFVVHMNFRAGSPFRSQFVLYLALWTGLAGATRLTRSDFMLHIGWIYFYQRGRFAWYWRVTWNYANNPFKPYFFTTLTCPQISLYRESRTTILNKNYFSFSVKLIYEQVYIFIQYKNMESNIRQKLTS